MNDPKPSTDHRNSGANKMDVPMPILLFIGGEIFLGTGIAAIRFLEPILEVGIAFAAVGAVLLFAAPLALLCDLDPDGVSGRELAERRNAYLREFREYLAILLFSNAAFFFAGWKIFAWETFLAVSAASAAALVAFATWGIMRRRRRRPAAKNVGKPVSLEKD